MSVPSQIVSEVMQHYVIKFDLLWFSSGTPVSSTNRTDSHDITDILLKVELNIIYHNPNRKWVVEYICIRIIDLAYFCDFAN